MGLAAVKALTGSLIICFTWSKTSWNLSRAIRLLTMIPPQLADVPYYDALKDELFIYG